MITEPGTFKSQNNKILEGEATERRLPIHCGCMLNIYRVYISEVL